MTDDFASEPLSVADEAAEAVAASDARLDATVREAAEAAYGKQEPLPTPHGRTMDQTIADTMARIQRRPPAPSMPPLKAGHTIDEAVDASAEWLGTSKSAQRSISDAHRQLAGLKQAAESFGIELRTASDVKALQDMMAGRSGDASARALDNDLSEALSPGQPDQALPVLRETVQAIQRDRVGGTRQLLDNMGVHPLHLLSPHEQQALAGSHGGEIGAVVARNHDIFAQNGIPPAQAFEALLAAHRMFERDPAGAIQELARQNNVDLAQLAGGEAQAMGQLVETWAEHKGSACTTEVRQLMAEIVQEPGFPGSGNLLAQLNAAFTEARRRLSARSRRDPGKKLEDSVDRAAAEVYGKRARRR